MITDFDMAGQSGIDTSEGFYLSGVATVPAPAPDGAFIDPETGKYFRDPETGKLFTDPEA